MLTVETRGIFSGVEIMERGLIGLRSRVTL